MIHKVDGNNYPVYTKQKSIDIPDTGEKFNLGSDRNSSPSETKTQREKEAADKGKQQAERSGVRLELSGNGRMADAGRQKQQEAAKAQASAEQQPLFETIRTFVMSIVTAVQEFFSKIWNDQPPAGATQEAAEGIGAEAAEIVDAVEVMDAAEGADTPEAAGTAENTGLLEAAGAAEIIDTSDIADVAESLGFGKRRKLPKARHPWNI